MEKRQQQTDKEKARKSSIGDAVTLNEPKKEAPTPEPTTPTPTTTPSTTPPTATTGTGSYYQDVYLPKVQEQKAKRWIKQVETEKTSFMNSKDIVTSYESGNLKATDMEMLRETDPDKYAEVKIELDRKRSLNAINLNQEQYLDTVKTVTNHYLDKREQAASDTSGAELKQQIFQQYGLNESNERIKTYTKQLDDLDDQIRDLSQKMWEAAGWDALAYRAEYTRQLRDLTNQRIDITKARATEVDYYRLWLEQADDILEEYKYEQAQQQQLDEKRFEAIMGMTQMEFQSKDQQLREELTMIDKEEEKYNLSLEKQAVENEKLKEEMQDRYFVASLSTLYGEFDDETKSVLMWMWVDNAKEFMKTYQSILKENKLERDQYDTVKMDDWTVLLFNKNNRNDYSVITTGTLNEGNVLSNWSVWGQCWEYVNKALWLYNTGHFTDTLEEKVALMKTRFSPVPIKWSVFVMDTGSVNGHVGIVTLVNADWTINITDSNFNWTERVRNTTIDPKNSNILWYYVPPSHSVDKVVKWVTPMKYWLTKQEQELFDTDVKDAVGNGDRELALSHMRQAYKARLWQKLQDIQTNREELAFSLWKVSDMIDKYVQDWGDLWFFTGTNEEIANKVGKTNDPRIAEMRTYISDMLDILARARTGAAITESEEKFYRKMLPSVGKSLEYNKAIIKAQLQRATDLNWFIDESIKGTISTQARDFLYPPEWDEKDFFTRLNDTKASQFLVD